MTDRRKTWLKRLLILPPVAVGLAVLALLAGGREAPQQVAPGEAAQPVRVVEVRPIDFVPRAVGHGFVQPGQVWEAVAEVSGEIVYRHPELERGQLIEAGTVVLRIDPADYELAIARIDAALEGIAAQLAELDLTQTNTEALRGLERRALALAEQQLSRQRTLRARGTTSEAAVDEAERTMLTIRQRVQELDNALNLIPAQRRALEAERARLRAEREEAALDLERTTIATPFDGRVAEAAGEEGEYAAPGEVLAVVDGIATAEVAAQIAINHMAPLIPRDIAIADLSAAELAGLPERFGIDAVVRLDMGERMVSWDARLDRISDTIDPQTRTIGAIVTVADPYRQAIPGIRPPLAKNMYVEVVLRGRPRPDTLVVPRVAVHRGRNGRPVVYVAGPDDRLVFREVDTGPTQGDLTVITSGLRPGDRVVATDLIPAIEGMLLAPTPDAALTGRLHAEGRAIGPEAMADGQPSAVPTE